MFRALAIVVCLSLILCAGGCRSTWEANHASEAVTIDWSAIGSGQPAITPADGPGYMNGMPQDMRYNH
jgi:hypothetical protein